MSATDHPYAPQWCVHGVCFDYVVHPRPAVAVSIAPTLDRIYRSGTSFLTSNNSNHTTTMTTMCRHGCEGTGCYYSYPARTSELVRASQAEKAAASPPRQHQTTGEANAGSVGGEGVEALSWWACTSESRPMSRGRNSTNESNVTHDVTTNTKSQYTTVPVSSSSGAGGGGGRDAVRVLTARALHRHPTTAVCESEGGGGAAHSSVVEMYHFAISFEEKRRRYLLMLRTSDIREYIKWTTCLALYMHEGSVCPSRHAASQALDATGPVGHVRGKCGRANSSDAPHATHGPGCCVKGMYRPGNAPECVTVRLPCNSTEISRALNRQYCLQWNEGEYARVIRAALRRLASINSYSCSEACGGTSLFKILWPLNEQNAEKDDNECTFYGA